MNNEEFETLFDILRILVAEDLKDSPAHTAMIQVLNRFSGQLLPEQKALLDREFNPLFERIHKAHLGE